MRKIIIASIAALGLASTSAIAQTTVGGGVSASGPQGSIAGGATAGTADERAHERKRDRDKDHRNRRGARQQERGNSASTFGSGTVYTDQHRATGGVTTGASASGTDRQRTSSTVDAYGSTTHQGSEAEVYGDSTARSGR